MLDRPNYTLEEIKKEIGATLRTEGKSRLQLGYLLIDAQTRIGEENGSVYGHWGRFLSDCRISVSSSRRYMRAAEWLSKRNVQLNELGEDAAVHRIAAGLLDNMVDGAVDDAIITRVFAAAEHGYVGLDDVAAWEAGFATVEEHFADLAAKESKANEKAAAAAAEKKRQEEEAKKDGDEDGDGDEDADGENDEDEDGEDDNEDGKSRKPKSDQRKLDRLIHDTVSCFDKDLGRRASRVEFAGSEFADADASARSSFVRFLNTTLPPLLRLVLPSKEQLAAIRQSEADAAKREKAKPKKKAARQPKKTKPPVKKPAPKKKKAANIEDAAASIAAQAAAARRAQAEKIKPTLQ
jgi:hypothetical protein